MPNRLIRSVPIKPLYIFEIYAMNSIFVYIDLRQQHMKTFVNYFTIVFNY